jgi:hypothetical protein
VIVLCVAVFVLAMVSLPPAGNASPRRYRNDPSGLCLRGEDTIFHQFVGLGHRPLADLGQSASLAASQTAFVLDLEGRPPGVVFIVPRGCRQ